MAQDWPLRDDYQNAVLNPQVSFADPRLRTGEVERNLQMGPIRVPRPRAGGFGAVYKYRADGRDLALKVFTSSDPERELRYQLVGSHLAGAPAGAGLVGFQYQGQGIQVAGRWFPLLVMDWVDGTQLDIHIGRAMEGGSFDRSRIMARWVEIVLALKRLGIAHGDLQHGNILVRGGAELALVDYDGMFVPALAQRGLISPEAGLAGYTHRLRPSTRTYFDRRLDDLPALVILLTLAVVDRDLWRRYPPDDSGLLFHQADLRDPDASPLFKELVGYANVGIRKLALILRNAARGPLDEIPDFADIVADSSVRALMDQPQPLVATTPLESVPTPADPVAPPPEAASPAPEWLKMLLAPVAIFGSVGLLFVSAIIASFVLWPIRLMFPEHFVQGKEGWVAGLWGCAVLFLTIPVISLLGAGLVYLFDWVWRKLGLQKFEF
jgi:predicted Ser/Thr protein kinase